MILQQFIKQGSAEWGATRHGGPSSSGSSSMRPVTAAAQSPCVQEEVPTDLKTHGEVFWNVKWHLLVFTSTCIMILLEQLVSSILMANHLVLCWICILFCYLRGGSSEQAREGISAVTCGPFPGRSFAVSQPCRVQVRQDLTVRFSISSMMESWKVTHLNLNCKSRVITTLCSCVR